jgi:hypothetical protein
VVVVVVGVGSLPLGSLCQCKVQVFTCTFLFHVLISTFSFFLDEALLSDPFIVEILLCQWRVVSEPLARLVIQLN